MSVRDGHAHYYSPSSGIAQEAQICEKWNFSGVKRKEVKEMPMEQKAGNVAMMHHACSGRMATERVA